MSLALDRSPSHHGRSVRLDTLVRVRWLAIAGQTATIGVVGFIMNFPLPTGWCLALVALSAWVNLALRLRFPSSQRFSERATMVLLGYDVLQLAGLLYLTGGLQNPFSFLLIAPVMISATALPPPRTLMLGALVVVVATVLGWLHMPLPWYEGEQIGIPIAYTLGIWVALVSTLSFMGIFAFRVAEENRQLADALATAELVLAREQHLNALDGLAAAAAHQLGTPLATIALVAKELESEIQPGDGRAEDIRLLRTQADRCRDILRQLASMGVDPESPLERMELPQLLEEVSAPHRDFDVEIVLVSAGDPALEPVFARNPAILYGLGNIIENAVDFASERVEVTAAWNDETVSITVADDGPGFAVEIIERLGEPYVTTRPGAREEETDEPRPEVAERGGLGLGFFIAKTLLERTGAGLSLANRKLPDRGAVVTIVWPRASVDHGGDRSGRKPAELGRAR